MSIEIPPSPHQDDPTPANLPTPDESAPLPNAVSNANARALFQPTIERMSKLTWHLLQMTGNGDFAVLLPLATLAQTLAELRWHQRAATPDDRRQVVMLLTLGEIVLTDYAKFMGAERDRLYLLPPGEKMPPYPDYDEALLLAAYARAEATPFYAKPEDPTDAATDHD